MKKKKTIIPIEEKPLKLNIACGNSKVDGYVGIDISKNVGADIVHDLKKYPWPFKDNSVDEAICSHFIEHLDGMERIPFFNECYRIMKDGATMKVITPAPFTHRYMQDFSHKFPMVVQESYNYLSQAWLKAANIHHYAEWIKCNFEWSGFFQPNNEAMAGRNDEYQHFASKYYINSLLDLVVTLKKVEIK